MNFEWLRCKKCNKLLMKLTDKSVIINEVYCRCCKTAFDVEVVNGKVIKNEEKFRTIRTS